jgi:predicted small secreted protein
MKKLALAGAAAMLLSLGLFGCNNTAEGVSKDASTDSQKMASAANDATTAAKITADKAGYETKKAADETADATKKAAMNAEDATKKAASTVATDTKEAATATEAASKKAAADAAVDAKSAGKNITDVTEVAPKVQLAIDADKDLNDTHNSIKTTGADGVIHLTGHVYSASMKKKATADATKALKDLNATDKLSNELTVSGQ